MSRDERLYAALVDVFDEMDDEDYIDLHNDFARDDGYNMIYHMYDLDEVCQTQMGYTLDSFMRDLGQFDIDDEYFTNTDTNTINSFDSLLDGRCPIDRDEMIRYIVDTGYGAGNEAVEEVLDSFAHSID